MEEEEEYWCMRGRRLTVGERKERVDSTSVSVKLDKTAEFALHVVYRSPNSSRQNDEDLCRWVESLKGENLIIGDLNFPGIQWEAGRTYARGRLFHQACSNMFLEQLVTEATHKNGNRLDLVFTNRRERIKEVRMEGRLFTDTGRPNQGRRCRNFNRANYKEARAMIGAVNWSEDLGPMNVEEAWQKVKGTLTEVIENYVPWRKVQTKPRPKLYNREVEQNIKKKRNAWNRWKKSKKPEDKEEYQRLERETKGMIRRRKKGLEKSIAREAKKNPKAYYAYVNSGKKMRNKVGPLKVDENGETKVVTDPKKQAGILNSFYSSMFTKSTGEIQQKERAVNVPEVTDVCLEEVRIKETILKLKESSAPGPDAIPNKLLIETVDEITRPLSILFMKSLRERHIPDDWRCANVTPIFKKGAKSDPGNYRPVSLTSAVCKLMERLVKETIEKHLEQNNLIGTSQHGFRKGRSTQTNLIEFMEQTTEWMDAGKSFEIVFIDFAKAFDVVCHDSLVVKLRAKGIDGDLLAWIADWLKGRKQRVVVEGEMSESADVVSGVVQGSSLGGTLFTIFIDDIDEFIRALIRKKNLQMIPKWRGW